MLSKSTFQNVKLYVWIGHYILLMFPFRWNGKEQKFTSSTAWNGNLVQLVIRAQILVKLCMGTFLVSFSWVFRDSIAIWELTMNLFLVSGLLITTPLYYVCLRAGAATGTLLNSITLLNNKIAYFHNLPEFTTTDGLERAMNSIRIAVLLLLFTCPIANLTILEYYHPQSVAFIMSLSPIPIQSTLHLNLFTSAAVSYAFAADAFIASGFVQFSMIVINVTNEWLKRHTLRPQDDTATTSDLEPVPESHSTHELKKARRLRHVQRFALLRAIHVMHRTTTEQYAYRLNPVYILSSVIFIVILLFLIIRFFMSLNLVVTCVLIVTVLVALYCMEVSYKMGTKTIEYSPNLSQYYGARPRLTPEELRFIKSCPPLEWRMGVFYGITNGTFALIMSEFAIPSVINLLLSGL